MTNKNIYRSLGGLDPELIEKAAPAEHPQRKKGGAWLKWAPVAACLAIIVGTAIAVPMLRNSPPPILPGPGTEGPAVPASSHGGTPTGEADIGTDPLPDPIFPAEPPAANITLDSLDKINFYGGLKAISDSRTNLPTEGLCLSAESGSTSLPVDLTGKTLDGGPDFDHKISWDLTDETMTIKTAVYFRINVTESDTPLASKIGVGEAEVVVTDISIGINPFAMITFKNGDKFFSCLSDMYALKEGENRFGSHLYIRGFEMYKDPVGEMTAFYTLELDIEGLSVLSFGWHYFTGDAAVEYGIEPIPETVAVSRSVYEFTIEDLNSYWGAESTPADAPEGETESPPQGLPEIYDDGMLRYYLVDGEYYEVSGIYNRGFSNLVIPNSLFGAPVKGIQGNAFRNYKYLTSVVIPDSVEYIGPYAFFNCENLTSVQMPEDIRIGHLAFGMEGDAETAPIDGTIPFDGTEPPDTVVPIPGQTTETTPDTALHATARVTRSDGAELTLDGAIFDTVMSMCESLGGASNGSSQGYYGALYTVTYTDGNGSTDIYTLWDETTYSHGFVAFIGQSSYIYPDLMIDPRVGEILATLDELFD